MATTPNYDAQFRMRSILSNFDEYVERYRLLSAQTRRELRHLPDCRYGPASHQLADIFLPNAKGSGRAVHVFVHGGYWRAFDKSDYLFVARAIVSSDAVAVVPNYGLMPTVSLAELVAQCQELIPWLHNNALRLEASPDRISVSGHSSGAHVASLLALTRWEERGMPRNVIKSTLAVSGIFELHPILHSFVKNETGMTAEDAVQLRPTAWAQRGHKAEGPVILAVGSDEPGEFHRQSASFAQTLASHDSRVELLSIARRNHMVPCKATD